MAQTPMFSLQGAGMNRNWLASLSTVALCLILIVSAAAQSDRGAIAGSVLDSTGAAVASASVTITGADTGSVYKTVSSPTGGYRVNDLAIGRYDVTVQAQGFKLSLQKGVDIQINTVTALNVTLEPGDVKEEVTVLADAPTLQTESSDMGTVVEDKQIHDLPLSLNATGQSGGVRSPEAFIFLTPGTIGQGTNSDHGSAGVFESKISGGQNFGSEILLDGASVQRSDSGTAFDQTAPSVEALTEFKVTTSTPSAQFGHTSGGVESFTTKSGTNAYHGSVFELFHNEALNAQPWANDWANTLANYDNGQIQAWNAANPGTPYTGSLESFTKKPRDRQNDFGGALGGPVRIPWVYNGHDKTFFFFAWEQYRNRRGLINDLQTLPSPAEAGGDFSALLGPGLVDGSNNPIINPCNGQQVLQGQIFDPSTTQVVGGQTCRLPFAGNKITNISQVAQNFLKYLPQPNRAGGGVGGVQNNFLNPATLDHVVITQTSFRIDENLTEKQKFFFSYHSREQSLLNGQAFDLPAPLTPGNYYNYYFTHYLRVGWDYILSPSVLNHLTVGFNRVYTSTKAPSVNGSDWEKVLGISGASGPTFPQVQFNGAQYGTSYSQWSANNDNLQVPNALVVADSVSWTKGRHSLRFGFDWRSYQYSLENKGVSSPFYIFYNYQTAYAPLAQNPEALKTGDPFASFLLGEPNEEQLQVSSHFSRWQQNYYAVYAQDDFKASKNLTLNLGLRWDIETPRHEATGAQSVLSLTAANPLTPGQTGALIYGKSATGASTYFKNFAPRVGFAYAPDRWANTVIRGAYSIYYAPLTYSDFGDNLASGTTATPDFKIPDNFTPVQSFDAGFPAFTLPGNTKDPTLNTFTTNPVFYVASSYGRPGMVQNWDIEVQHQITTDLIVSAGYVGQHGTRLRSNLAQINTPNPIFNSLGAALGFQVDGSDGNNGPAILNSLGITVPSWFTPGWGSGSGLNTIGQLLRPFPQYGSITSNCCLENLGQSTYNAFQTKLERRFRNGLNLLASYTYSKTFTDADSSFSTETGFNSNVFGAQNPYNLKGEKALSYQDVPHAFVMSYLYELPAGPGKRFFNHGVGSKVLGGWQISGIHRYQSGAPTVINEFATANPFSGGNYRYSLVPGHNPLSTGVWTPATNMTANGGRRIGIVNGNVQFIGGWNSICESTNGVFSTPSPTQFPPQGVISPTPANCAAFEDPSAVSLASGGGYAFGNIPEVVGWWRSPHYLNEDFSIIKRTTIREGQNILFKLDLPNAFNRHTFGGIDGDPLFDNFFGVPGGGGHSVINAPRTIQATLRYEF